MNIFVLDENPLRAAAQVCDKHAPKMVLETAQLLCGAWPQGDAPYRRTHVNHPCARWVRASRANFFWLCEYGIALAQEYTMRFGREHASERVIRWCAENAQEVTAEMPEVGLTPFAQAMPEAYRVPGDAVTAYRRYYQGDKARFARWARGRAAPSWWGCGGAESA